MLTPVEKTSLVDEVARKLHTGIITGYFQPGEKLIEETLSQQMKTSRGPIRDAFIRLEHEGLVVREPNRSVTVVRLTEEDVREIHILRLTLEQLAVEILCETWTPEHRQILVDAEETLLASVRRDAPLEESVELDTAFHESLVRTSGHARLLSAWQTMRSQIELLIFSRSYHNEPVLSDGASRHQDLISSIEARDKDLSKRILTEHLEGLRDWIVAGHSSQAQ